MAQAAGEAEGTAAIDLASVAIATTGAEGFAGTGVPDLTKAALAASGEAEARGNGAPMLAEIGLAAAETSFQINLDEFS